MATYREIHGKAIKSLDTDPSASTDAGQIWYNTASNTFKSIVNLEAWSSASSLSTARSGLAGGGIQTAAWGVGGVTSFPATTSTLTEEYNGSGWSAGGAIPTGKVYAAGAGPQTAGLVAAGGPPFSPSPGGAQTTTFSYNGTAWSAETATPVGLWTNAGFGSEPAFVSVGSEPNSTNYVFNYNGSSWTTGGTMNSIRSYVGACGTQTAGGAIAGWDGATENKFETYDGSSWTAGPTLNTSRYALSGSGSTTSAFAAGGRTPSGPENKTELYDGSSWTASATMGTGKAYAAESNNDSNNTAAIVFAGSPIGDPSTILATSEEFNSSINAVTAAAWASGGAMNTARRGICSAKNATQNAALGALGYTPANPPAAQGQTNSEHYDGSTWTNSSAVPTGRYFGGGFGIQTAAVICGGYSNSPAGQKTTTDEWDGSSWSSGEAMPPASNGRANMLADGFGVLTAGVVAGGPPAPYASTIEYDGTNWTAGGAANTPRSAGASFGILTAGIAVGGNTPGSPGYPLDTESYNGTAWTSVNNCIYGGYGAAAGGTQTAGFSVKAEPTAGGGTQTQGWDGSVWSTQPSRSVSSSEQGGAGTATAGIAFAGATSNPTTVTGVTEEFTGVTTSLNVKTLTQS